MIQILTSLGDDSSVGRDDNRDLEVSLESVNKLVLNLSVEHEGSEGDSDEDVLGLGAISLLELNGLNRVDEDKSGELLNFRVLLFVVGEGLGSLLFELGNLGLYTNFSKI